MGAGSRLSARQGVTPGYIAANFCGAVPSSCAAASTVTRAAFPSRTLPPTGARVSAVRVRCPLHTAGCQRCDQGWRLPLAGLQPAQCLPADDPERGNQIESHEINRNRAVPCEPLRVVLNSHAVFFLVIGRFALASGTKLVRNARSQNASAM